MEIEIADDVFIITKDHAEAYLAAKAASAQPETTMKPDQGPVSPADGSTAPQPPIPTPVSGGQGQIPGLAGTKAQTTLTSEIAGFEWTGEIAPQKWMNFYTKVLSRFATNGGMRLTLKVEVLPPGGMAASKAEETKVALRELGMVESVVTR